MSPLVLLHGSGGGANELVPLAADLAPGAPTLGLRGSVEIDGGFAFFHRNPDRTIDEADLLDTVVGTWGGIMFEQGPAFAAMMAAWPGLPKEIRRTP